MNNFTDHAIISNILNKNLEMSVDEWHNEVKKPLLPFEKSLNKRMSKIKHLKQSATYNPKTTNRQCFMQVRWQYIHENLPPVAKKKHFCSCPYWRLQGRGGAKNILGVQLVGQFKRCYNGISVV